MISNKHRSLLLFRGIPSAPRRQGEAAFPSFPAVATAAASQAGTEHSVYAQRTQKEPGSLSRTSQKISCSAFAPVPYYPGLHSVPAFPAILLVTPFKEN